MKYDALINVINKFAKNIFEKEFINELENNISITLEIKEIDNVPGILYTIIGPKSKTENHITYKEAKVLCELLQKAL